MVETNVGLSQNQADNERNPETQRDDIVWEDIPEKRNRWRARLASVFICLLTAAGIIYHGFIESKTTEYNPVSDLSNIKLEAIKNGSIKCFTSEEKATYTVFLNLGLGLLAIILGTFVDRLSLIFEELFHFKSRYNRSVCKMLKACFSGISLGAVGVVILIVGISIVIPLVNNATFELGHVVYILSGIGVGPLVMHLLNLNTQSEVHISTILEEKHTYIANGLAWSYYFNYLAKALPKFRERFPDNICTSVRNQLGTQISLSLNKLILLISYDCETKDNLVEQDNTITKLMEIPDADGVYKFPVYSLPFDGKVYRFVIKYVRQPLETLQKMSQYERIKALPEKQRDYQVKLLYRTLSEIVKDPLDKECKEKCILVPIKAKSIRSLNNGGLVNAIMHKVKADESNHMDGFMIIPSDQKKEQPKATEDDSDFYMDGKIVDLPPSHKVTIDHVEGRAQYNKQDHAIDNRRREQAIERGKDPANGQLQRKYKGKSSPSERQAMLRETQTMSVPEMDDRQSMSDAHKESGCFGETDQMSSNLGDRGGEDNERRLAMNNGQQISSHLMFNLENGENNPKEDGNEETAFTGDSPSTSNRPGESENQSTSNLFEDQRGNCLREEVENGRTTPSYNLPTLNRTGESQDQPMSSHMMFNGENSPGGEEEDKASMSSTSMNGGIQL